MPSPYSSPAKVKRQWEQDGKINRAFSRANIASLLGRARVTRLTMLPQGWRQDMEGQVADGLLSISHGS